MSLKNRPVQSLYRRLAKRFLQILLLLGVLQALLLWFLWIRLNDQREQIISWNLASEIAPEFTQALAPGKSVLDLKATLSRIYAINPRLSIYVVSPTGKVLANLTGEESQVRAQIDIEPIKEFFKGMDAVSLPLYGEDPNHKKRKSIFSVVPINLEGEQAYLYVVLTTFKTAALTTFFVENSAIILSIFIGVLSFVSAGGLGVALLYLLTKRIRELTQGVTKFSEGDLSARVLESANDEIGFLGRTFNQMAEAIAQNIKDLEQRDQIRRALIADVSHDLRGPLGVIKGYLKRLEEQQYLSNQAERVKTFQVLNRSTSSLQTLLSQLFELAKLEAKEKKLELIKLDLSDLLSALHNAFMLKASELEVFLRLDIPEALPQVLADATLLERALSNLLDNAIRYTPAGGTVILRAVLAGEHVRIEINDTGKGISADDLASLGEKFFQVQGQVPRSGESTGLGLAIVKHIVQAHGTSLEIKSILGKGTSFGFTLAQV